MEINKRSDMLINIITPCSRPQYLKQLLASINFSCKWYIMFDGEKGDEKFKDLQFLNKDWIVTDYTKEGVWGYPQRNLALDKIKEGWVFVLDDDNLIHPSFYEITKDIITKNPTMRGIFYSQQITTSNIRKVEHAKVKLNHIDQGQFLLHRDIIGDKRYGVVKASDGRFIESLYKNADKNLFYFHNDPVITFYNRLKWKTT